MLCFSAVISSFCHGDSDKLTKGIYIVALLNETPLSSYGPDSRRKGAGALVNREHIKFGKTVDLLRRRRDYIKTFGAENIDFTSIIEGGDIDDIEHRIKLKVGHLRITSLKRRKLEWLHGIDKATLEEIIRSVAK